MLPYFIRGQTGDRLIIEEAEANIHPSELDQGKKKSKLFYQRMSKEFSNFKTSFSNILSFSTTKNVSNHLWQLRKQKNEEKSF